MKKTFSKYIAEFLKKESSSGILLAFATILAFIVANSKFNEMYFGLLNFKILGLSIQLWVNDALMAIFFFVIGLEIKREVVSGELSTPKKALLPLLCALGGMVFPALIYLYFNPGLPASKGWGIPMATDIAFAVGILSFLGPRVPFSLKILLLAIAIVDDLGAILAIAFFYTEEIRNVGLAVAALSICIVLGMRILRINKYRYFIPIGGLVWFGFLYSGVHATIAGVILGLLTPVTLKLKDKGSKSLEPVNDLIHKLHPFTSFLIMPIFAFANAGVDLSGMILSDVFFNPIYVGIVAGLVVGKPFGILITSFFAHKMKLVSLPSQVTWAHIISIGLLAGIGFTMSLFISSLALPTNHEIYSKVGIITASLLSGLAGFLLLKTILRSNSL